MEVQLKNQMSKEPSLFEYKGIERNSINTVIPEAYYVLVLFCQKIPKPNAVQRFPQSPLAFQ